jgi:3-deoxy-D-manno-octulosonic-acid transferase
MTDLTTLTYLTTLTFECRKNSKIQVVYPIAFTFAPTIKTCMSILLYNIFLFFFNAATRIASLFNVKAKKWIAGRKHIFENLEKAISPADKVIWVHCASLGEFEQGKPIIEKLKAQGTRLTDGQAGHKILLTFFSPSGYDAQKDYKGADWVFYLPLDGPRNAKRFLEIVHPTLVIFVKYEFWYYYLKKIRYRNIPLLLVSALFRKDMSFFKWYGGLQRKMLSRFDHLFVQNESSKKLIGEIGLSPICSVSGDTRFDRVIEIANEWKPVPGIEEFIGNQKAIIAGSTWREDEAVLQKAFAAINEPLLKLIIAPHEISEKHIDELEKLLPNSIRFSRLTTHDSRLTTVLIIDNIGMLSRLYRYAYITYVGGGLRTMGVHNVLEAAVFGKPVIIGPYYEKYSEAVELVKSKGAIVIKNETELTNCINNLLKNAHSCYQISGKAAGNYIKENGGATQKIIQFIQEKRLLTN